MSSDRLSWVDEHLAAAGIERAGEVEEASVRPWATVLKVPTAGGPVWFKAAAPSTAFEVGLYDLFLAASPDHVLTPIAIDLDRGWIVLPDGGTPLGDDQPTPEIWESVVAQYAELQRNLAPRTDRLLELGVTDMRPAVMPQRFDEAVEAVGDQRGLDAVAAMRPTVERWCAQLAASPVPASIDHNDLHSWNVFVGDDARARFYDWGDAVVSHPFASMLLPLAMLKLDETDPRFLRVRDAYLEVFSDLAPHAELVETLVLACRVGKIARALTWDRAIRALDPSEVDDQWVDAPFESLSSLMEDSYVGRA